MALVSRGKKRDQIRAVACTGKIHHGFKTKDLSAVTGVTEADVTALGQVAVSAVPADRVVVFGAQTPKGAYFRKKLGVLPVVGQNGSVSSYGNGSVLTAIQTAAAAGWSLVRPIRLTTVRSTIKSVSVGATLSNGLIYVQPIPVGEANDAPTMAALGLILPSSFRSAEKAKAVRGADNLRPAKVTKIDPATGISITLPCSHDKIADAAAIGFFEASAERVAIAAAE